MDLSNLRGIGRDQWIKYHYNGCPKRILDTDDFKVIWDVKKPADIMSFKDAALRTAHEIKARVGDTPIYVAMSGGADSECVAQAFHDAKIPFTPIIMHIEYFNTFANRVDAWWAHKWCNENGYKPHILKISGSDLLYKFFDYNAKLKTRIIYPLMLPILADEVKKLGGACIQGEADITWFPDPSWDHLRVNNDPSVLDENGELKRGWFMIENDFYGIINDKDYDYYNFLTWSPEIVRAWCSSYNPEETAEQNKHRIMGGVIRPKIGSCELLTFGIFLEKQRYTRANYGTYDSFSIGSHEELIRRLDNPGTYA
jgi:hypothetical protein